MIAELEAARHARRPAAKLADARAESAALREELAVTQRARDAALADARARRVLHGRRGDADHRSR